MTLTDWMPANGLPYLVLPALIFLLRIGDVTLGTLRIVYVSRGMKTLSVAFAFFEVLIWLFAVGQILNHLDHPAGYFAFAAGYATGNYVGIWVEEKLSLGCLMLRVFTCQGSEALATRLREAGFGVTRVNACGSEGPAELLLTVLRRKDCDQALRLLRTYAPRAFYTLEEVKSVSQSPFSRRDPQRPALFARQSMSLEKSLAAR